MNEASPFAAPVLVQIGPMPLTATVVTSWAIMAVLAVSGWLIARRLRARESGTVQTLAEGLVVALADQIEDAIKQPPERFLPLIATLFIFLVAANLSPLIPGVRAPTAKLETAAALALVVFAAAHWYGIRAHGVGRYLGHYLKPNPLLLPLNILSELTRTFSLAVRLFGNIMSHELIIALLLGIAGLLIPIPLMALGILIGLVQAYIFTVLATIFIGAAVGAFEAH